MPGSEPIRHLRSAPILADASQRRPDLEREALTRVAAAAAGAHRLEDVLELVAEEGRRAISAASLSVSRWDRERDVIQTLINVGDLGPNEVRYPEGELYPLSSNPKLAKMLKLGQSYSTAVDDPKADRAAVEVLQAVGKESDIAVPVLVEGETWGEVWATTAPGQARFQAADVRFLGAIAARLGQVLGRAELFSRVSQLAYEDSLTGLANRRALLEELDRAAARSADGEAELTVLICDVDGLKPINDERGHEAGDRALRLVAQALVAASARWSQSTVGRLAGDEFCVLLEGGDLSAAEEVAAAALSSLAAERDGRLSISAGAARAGPGAHSPAQLLKAADAAQYAAKRRGGGQFCTAAGAALDGDLRVPAPADFMGDPIRGAVSAALAMLDGNLRDADALDRLEAVAMAFSRAVNAASWTVSRAAEGTGVIESLATANDRDSRLRGMRVGPGDEIYSLADFPATAALVEAGAGTFHCNRRDRRADPAESALLVELGRDEVLAAAARCDQHTFLVELFGDAETERLGDAQQELGLLVRAAMPARSRGVPERPGRHLEAVSTITAALADLTDERSILQAAADHLHTGFGWPLCAVMKASGDVLEVAAHATQFPLQLGWSQPRDAGLAGRCLRQQRVVVVDDVLAEPDYRPHQQPCEVRSALQAPILVDGEAWGVLDVEHPDLAAFDEHDARLASTAADLVGSALGSAALYGRLERAYLGTAEALSAALEAKDSYTASHSHGIVTRAEAVGRLMSLDDEQLRLLRLGAAFHDIGKLGIPEATLNKTGALTVEERELLQQHTVIGERILAPIEFLTDVLPLVRHAHERWDGYGYPDGLAGEEIPLGARIIFACDAWDAMTTDRPYRQAMSAAEAAQEMQRGAGSQFDATVVEAVMQVVGPV